MKPLALLVASFLISTNAFAVVKVNGAGASFPYPIYSKWFAEYEKTNKNVQFNYQAIGSGGGIRQLIKQTVDFGASDAPMKEKDKKKAAWPVKHVPTVIGALAVTYNLPSVKDLKIDGPTLAKIFLTEITKWNDPAIAKLNKGTALPDKDILVVRRADGSGSTFIVSDFLSTTSPAWKKKMGTAKTLRWPGTTIGAKGNDGVTGVIKKTEGSIGYIELAYALKNGLYTASVKNKDGNFIQPTIDTISAAASEVSSKNVTNSIVFAPGKISYPISAFTYILLPASKDEKLNEVKSFLKWALTEGQNLAPQLHYAPLPKSFAHSILNDIN